MIIIKGKNSGFCFGVKNAIDKAYSQKGNNNFILGEIIHNDLVNDKLKENGLITVNSIEDKRIIKGANLLIRTHGESKKIFDRAKELGLNVLDYTCPFVKNIHQKVYKHYQKGYKIVIIGDKNHPEVQGINGWCDDTALITEDVNEINNLNDNKICIVVQTTYKEDKFNEIIKKIDNKSLKIVDIFKTICYTTTIRQSEAKIISQKCDAVLVIGGKNSNNTNNLFGICKINCINTFRIYDPSNFDYEKLKIFKKVGIVFGASTPIEQFQEVIQHMDTNTEEIVEQTIEQENAQVAVDAEPKAKKTPKSEMEKAFDNIKPSRNLHIGQVVSAKISSVTDEGFTISIKDIKTDFELPKNELIEEFNKDANKDKVGKEIRVMVIAKNPLKFSEKAMKKLLAEEAEVELIKNGKEFEAVIESTNKGGLIGKYGSYQVFVPSSQIRIGFVKDLDKYIGKKLRLKAEKVESHGARRQIVGSQRVIIEAEKAVRDAEKAAKEAEFFDNVQVGDVVLGTPVRFTSFGAFINVNGFDCLAHISDLSWTGCKDCSEVLTIGKEYEFKVLKIDVETKKVSVGYRQLQPKPWESVTERYNIGDVITGKVVRIVSFGAFVEVEKGIDGLVHVSQITDKWLENPISELQVGQEVTAKIISIDPEREKMNLSIKALIPHEDVVEEKAEEVEDKKVKGKKRAKKEEADPEEIREWTEDNNSGTSIADLIK